jgi:hypothetical protein
VVGVGLEPADDEPASERAGQRGDDDVARVHDPVSCGEVEVDSHEADDSPAEEGRDRGENNRCDSMSAFGHDSMVRIVGGASVEQRIMDFA